MDRVTEKRTYSGACLKKLMVIFSTVFISSCGPNIYSGRNGQTHGQGSELTGPDDTTETSDQGATATETPKTKKATGTCYGAVSKSLKKFEELCKDPLTVSKNVEFKNILNVVCTERRFQNALHPSCGWTGPKDGATEKEAIKDASSFVIREDLKFGKDGSLYYFGVSSVVLPTTDEPFSHTYSLLYSNPAAFDRKFGIPEYIAVTNIKTNANPKLGDLWIDYKILVDIENKGKFGFRSSMDVFKTKSGMHVFYDNTKIKPKQNNDDNESEGEFQMVKERRNVTIVEHGKENTTVLLLEEFKVDAKHIQSIILPKIPKFLAQRLYFFHQNALR